MKKVPGNQIDLSVASEPGIAPTKKETYAMNTDTKCKLSTQSQAENEDKRSNMNQSDDMGPHHSGDMKLPASVSNRLVNLGRSEDIVLFENVRQVILESSCEFGMLRRYRTL